MKEKFCCHDCKYSWEDKERNLDCADFCPVLKEMRRKYLESKN